MVAVVEAGGGQAAKRSEATDGEGKPPPPQPVRVVRKHRQPTPDHPPYSWMIGEAIDELSEHGGSEEDSISAFIRARHPGVPRAHDKFLRHYLNKHVAEGSFVCTAAGRYLRSSKEETVEDCPLEQVTGGSSEVACVGPPVAKAKRGRGRPRKDGSSPAGKKDAAPSHTPRRGRRRVVVGLTDDEDSVPTSLVPAAKDSVPASLVAVPDKDGSQATSSTPKRRRLRKLGMATATTDNSGKTLATASKDGIEVPYTPEKEHEPSRELALVIIGDDSATTSIMDKACSEVPPTTPGEGGQPLELALVTTTDISVLPLPAPTPAMDKDSDTINRALVTKNDSICTISTTPEPSSQACDLAPMVADDISVPVLVADTDGVEEAPSATYNGVHQPHGSASTAAKKAGRKALFGTPNGCRRRCNLAKVVSPSDCSSLTPIAGKKTSCKVKVSFSSPKLTPVTAGCSTPSVADQDSKETRKLYPVTANEIPDDPAFCLLALPCVMPAAAKA